MPEVNGTTYNTENRQVIDALERCRASKTRIHVAYGNDDGQDWGETFETKGYVGRSMGPMKVPLLIHNSRSMGGGPILCDKVIRVAETRGGRVLYQHPAYKPPKEV